jgi:hypothetical protein
MTFVGGRYLSLASYRTWLAPVPTARHPPASTEIALKRNAFFFSYSGFYFFFILFFFYYILLSKACFELSNGFCSPECAGLQPSISASPPSREPEKPYYDQSVYLKHKSFFSRLQRVKVYVQDEDFSFLNELIL